MTCMFGVWQIFERLFIKTQKRFFIVLLQRFLIQKLMEGHQASRVLHVREPTCMDALFLKYWSGCVRTRGWKPRLCGKPQLQRRPRLSWTTLMRHYSGMHFPEWRTFGWGFKVTPVHSDPKIIAFACDLWSFIIGCCAQSMFNFQQFGFDLVGCHEVNSN